MRSRLVWIVLLAGVVTLGAPARTPAQTRSPKVYEITMTSFRFEPDQIRVTEGDTVVLRLRNADTERRFAHDIASRYFVGVPLTVRGTARLGEEEGRRFVRLDFGQSAEVEFVAQNPGSYAFICSVFIHSWAGMTGALFVERR
ncbi:MAG: cupredoxin domain-containing protein [Armatimonadota bacterium]|nr:cupredoxin domain-containing protein [Armatimonadota bacterium]MDR7534627.1 cupredoxin domain-containing protein [Armatimonadota bacterium]MDR7535441.1 cupredoxin domain-containing protein [Armatimonadota bacterium]